MNFVFLPIFICAFIANADPMSILQPVKQMSLLEKFKENPDVFVSEMSEADPDVLRQILALLDGLLTTSENREGDLVANLDQKQNALNDANGRVIAAQDILAQAVRDQDAANAAVSAADADVAARQAEQGQAQTERDDAQQQHDSEIGSLNDEQAVLRQVIDILTNLLEQQPAGGWIQLDASDIANAVCERVKGTAAVATVSSSGDKIDFLGYQNIPNNPGVLRCDIPTSVNFNQVKGQFGLVAVSGHHPDDNFAISSWGEGTSDHLGYIAFGTDSHIIIPGGTKGKDLSTTATFTIPDTTVASTSTIRFEACQSYTAEDFQLGQFDIQIYALRD